VAAAPRNERVGPRHRLRCLRVHGWGGMLAGFYLLSANNVGWATCAASWMVRYYNGSSR
jgi:hypothetical protein